MERVAGMGARVASDGKGWTGAEEGAAGIEGAGAPAGGGAGGGSGAAFSGLGA